jgi:hypothetical protein
MDLKKDLHTKLTSRRSAVVSKLEGLSEYDLRRPMTPTGTNLLGLVKHLAGLEYAYLGDALGRPAPETLPWVEDGSIWDGADMWATAEDRSDELIALYGRASAHADASIDALDLDAPASVAHWPSGRRDTTLGFLLIHMIAETAQHAGHADIVRELIDGVAGADQDDSMGEEFWRAYVERIQAAADTFATAPPPPDR